jgi:hypothetical protein
MTHNELENIWEEVVGAYLSKPFPGVFPKALKKATDNLS